MKPCRKQKKLIALASAGLLADEPLRLLRAHLKSCAACRDYAAALADICQEHENHDRSKTEDVACGRILSRLVVAQRAALPSSGWDFLRRMRWLRAMSLAVGMVVLLGIVWMVAREKIVNPTQSTDVLKGPTPDEILQPKSEQPSLLVYRLAVNHSWEDLDRLLSRHEPQLLRKEHRISRRDWAEGL